MAKQRKPDREPSQKDQPRNRSEELAELAEQAVAAFREENTDAYKELVRAFDGESADVALFGHGRFSVALSDGDLSIEPNRQRAQPGTARGAIAPKTLLEILDGKRTPLEAFFAGDLIARAPSQKLHRAYDYFVRFSDEALRSKRLQELLERFRKQLAA